MSKAITRDMEVRKLSYNAMHKIASYMNHGDELKRFMLLIPKDLDDKNNVEVKKYTSSQLKALEEASEKMIPPKLAGHILFEEWSTSGKRRPNMGHLLNLLVEAELFRAADFVAMDLLEENSPTRPNCGLAAPVDIAFPSLRELSVNGGSDRNFIEFSSLASSEQGINSIQMPTTMGSEQFQAQVPNLSLLMGTPPIGQSQSIPSSSSGSSTSIRASSSNINIDSKPSESCASIIHDSSFSNQSIPLLSILQQHKPVATRRRSRVLQIDPLNLVDRFSLSDLKQCTDDFNDHDYVAGELTGRKLGAGGFGSVHLAVGLSEDIHLAAVKKLHRNYEKVDEKFELEINILSMHKHDNLVQLLGFCHDRDVLCLVYEYVSGGNLERRMDLVRQRRAHLSAHTRLSIAFGIALGIEYLHKAELIHRDVKSANVLLTDDDVPKLCDFGLLRALNSRTTTMVVGSSGYMAPEVTRGNYDDKVDIFAFGVVQLELLTALPVLDSDRREDLVTYVERTISAEGEILTLLDRSAGDEAWLKSGCDWFDTVAFKCLELSPNKRADINVCLLGLEKLCKM